LANLLDFVISAHGGLARWETYSDVVTDIEVRGKLCEARGWRGMVPKSKLLLSLRDQRTMILLPEGEGRLIMQPELVAQLDGQGLELSSLAHPRRTILQDEVTENWDVLRTAYFIGSVIRHAVTAPFLYTQPGFETEELEPWSEAGEVWRVLKVNFPANFEWPVQSQVAYYGSDGLLRKLWNISDVLGGMELVEYVTSYERVDGIMVATSREVFASDSQGRKREQQHLGQIRLNGFFFAD
jgi:hypothetical protein